MYAFDYQKAHSLQQASSVLQSEPDARLLAGGMTLLPSMKHRLAAPSRLIDIARLVELRGVQVDTDARQITLGSALRHVEVADSSTIRQALPALAQLAGMIGDPQVRARGTLGGSIANNDPSADYPAAVLGLDAVVITTQREIPAGEFFIGMFETALRADEIITAVRFSLPRRAAYTKFAQAASGYAMTGVMLADFGDRVRVAVTGAGASVFRWHAAEEALSKNLHDSAIEGLQHSPDGLTSDLHAPAAYRAHLIGVLTRAALRQVVRMSTAV